MEYVFIHDQAIIPTANTMMIAWRWALLHEMFRYGRTNRCGLRSSAEFLAECPCLLIKAAWVLQVSEHEKSLTIAVLLRCILI